MSFATGSDARRHVEHRLLSRIGERVQSYGNAEIPPKVLGI